MSFESTALLYWRQQNGTAWPGTGDNELSEREAKWLKNYEKIRQHTRLDYPLRR